MMREKYTVIVVGGGASGLMLATSLGDGKNKIAVLERGERVGRKLSATGNGQGNITNAFNAPYFSSTQAGAEKAGAIVARHSPQSLIAFFEDLGLLFETDERGRVYPAGRQASSLTASLHERLLGREILPATICRLFNFDVSGVALSDIY